MRFAELACSVRDRGAGSSQLAQGHLRLDGFTDCVEKVFDLAGLFPDLVERARVCRIGAAAVPEWALLIRHS
jgi:hypothetical protein